MVKDPKVLNIYLNKKRRGSVNIMRGTKWGNPYQLCIDDDREKVIKLYKLHILPKFTEKDLFDLKGKDLECCCAPLPCHGDLLLKAANKK